MQATNGKGLMGYGRGVQEAMTTTPPPDKLLGWTWSYASGAMYQC